MPKASWRPAGEVTGLAKQGWKDSHDAIFIAMAQLIIATIEVRATLGAHSWYGNTLARQQAMVWRCGSMAKGIAENLRRAVEKCFWMEDQHYALALDGNGQRCGESGTGLLFTGLPMPERGKAVCQRTAANIFNNGWGVRTLEAGAVRFNPVSYLQRFGLAA